MASPSWLLVSMGGRPSQRPGPSPTLGSFGPSHQRCHKSRVLLWDPPCAHGVSGTPHEEVCNRKWTLRVVIVKDIGAGKGKFQGRFEHQWIGDAITSTLPADSSWAGVTVPLWDHQKEVRCWKTTVEMGGMLRDWTDNHCNRERGDPMTEEPKGIVISLSGVEGMA